MKSFSDYMNRDKLDFLDALINAHCDELEQADHHNINICRRMAISALVRMNKENIESREAFVRDMRDEFQGLLDQWEALDLLAKEESANDEDK